MHVTRERVEALGGYGDRIMATAHDFSKPWYLIGKPAVVIFGAFNRVENFGYEGHVNLEEPDPECLGQRQTHPACVAAMKRITVERVLEAMERAFG